MTSLKIVVTINNNLEQNHLITPRINPPPVKEKGKVAWLSEVMLSAAFFSPRKKNVNATVKINKNDAIHTHKFTLFIT